MLALSEIEMLKKIRCLVLHLIFLLNGSSGELVWLMGFPLNRSIKYGELDREMG